MIVKRLLDLSFSILGLLLFAPLFLLISILIKLSSPGPVFFRQERVGRFGKPFRIIKFRTMYQDAEGTGRQITVGDDPRITRAGRFLREYKLDELPQLLNVILGELSLVGPRPEVPRYVALYPEAVRELVLSVPPGITDYASIKYRDENTILGRAANPDKAYIEEIMPAKLLCYQRYVAERCLLLDIKLIFATLTAIAGKSSIPAADRLHGTNPDLRVKQVCRKVTAKPLRAGCTQRNLDDFREVQLPPSCTRQSRIDAKNGLSPAAYRVYPIAVESCSLDEVAAEPRVEEESGCQCPDPFVYLALTNTTRSR